MYGMKARTRNPSLDGLRAISILLVITNHSGFGIPYGGVFGVQIFFVISGYLITRLLQEEHAKYGSIELRAFYIRRCFRIVPAAFAFIAVAALLQPRVRAELPYALTYTMCYHLNGSYLLGHLWSLSVEEQFYLLWPLALVVAYRWRAHIALGAICSAALFRFACSLEFLPVPPTAVHCFFPAVMDAIAAGCLLAVCEPRLRRWMPRAAISGPLMIALPIFTYSLAYTLWRGTFPWESASVSICTLTWGIVPLLLAAWLLLTVECHCGLLNNRLILAVGALSYSLYLWQQPFATRQHSSLLFSAFALVLLAGSSYFLIEQPMTKLGRRWSFHQNEAAERAIPMGTASSNINTGMGAKKAACFPAF